MLFFLLLLSACDAASYFVTTNGNAGNSGLSEGASWNLAHAFATARAGDTVNIKAGLYMVASTVTYRPFQDGTAAQPIVWRGYRAQPGDIVTTNAASMNYGDAVDPSRIPVIRQSNRANSRGEGTVFIMEGDYQHLENILVQYFHTAVRWRGAHGRLRNLITIDQGDLGRSTYSGSAVLLDYSQFIHASNCLTVNGGDQMWTLRSNRGTFENIKLYADNTVNPPDYYFLFNSIVGSNPPAQAEYNIARNIHVQRVGDLSHGGHGLVFKGELPVRHNIVEGFTVVNTIVEIQFPRTTNNTVRKGTVTFSGVGSDPGKNNAGAVFANGAYNNLVEDVAISGANVRFHDWQDGAPGDGGGSPKNNVVNRVSVRGGNACVTFYTTLNTRSENNKFYNFLCSDVAYLLHNRGPNIGTIFRNSIFRNVGRLLWSNFPSTGGPPTFATPVSYETVNFDNCAWTTPTGATITKVDSMFVNAGAANWALQAGSPLKGRGVATPYMPAGNDLGPIQPAGAATTTTTTRAPTNAATTTRAPTNAATTTRAPTNAATTTRAPTVAPTTRVPTAVPTTAAPTNAGATPAPTTVAPTNAPTTRVPTAAPTTAVPTNIGDTPAPTTTRAPTTAAPTNPGDTPAPQNGCNVLNIAEDVDRTFVLRVVDDFDAFNCVEFFGRLGVRMGLAVEDFLLLDRTRGSTVLTIMCATPVCTARIPTLMDAVRADGAVSGPAPPLNVLSARAQGVDVIPGGGNAPAPSGDGFPLWTIAIILGVLLLVAAAIVIGVLVARNRKNSRDAFSAPLSEYARPYSQAPISYVPAPARPVSTARQFRVIATVEAKPADSVIYAPQGSLASIELADWQDAERSQSPWVWGKIGSQEGYIAKGVLRG